MNAPQWIDPLCGKEADDAKEDAREDHDRCIRCGDTIIGDGTEEMDWGQLCAACLDMGDDDEPMEGAP